MISAKADAPQHLAASLTRKARRLAKAEAETRLREQQQDAGRWRSAHLLWPLFGKGEL